MIDAKQAKKNADDFVDKEIRSILENIDAAIATNSSEGKYEIIRPVSCEYWSDIEAVLINHGYTIAYVSEPDGDGYVNITIQWNKA